MEMANSRKTNDITDKMGKLDASDTTDSFFFVRHNHSLQTYFPRDSGGQLRRGKNIYSR